MDVGIYAPFVPSPIMDKLKKESIKKRINKPIKYILLQPSKSN
jgi:hypothetical protein